MDTNFFFWVNNAVQLMLTNHGDPFLNRGMDWFQNLAVIMIILQGAHALLKRDKPLDITAIVRYLFLVLFAMVLLQYYNIPMPGLNDTLHGYITGLGASLAADIDMSMTEKVSDKFADVILGMQSPSWHDMFSNFGAQIHYYLCLALLTLCQSTMVFVIQYGWVATGVLVLLGPLAIPWMIVPGWESVFYRWFSSLLQYSFYAPVANAFVFIYGHVFMNFFDFYPPPWDTAKIMAAGLVMLSMVFCIVFGFFKISGFVAGIFAGRSGEHTLPSIGNWRG